MSNTSSPLSKLAIEQMKRDAKRIAKSQNISHAQALDQQAEPLGYANWSMLMQHANQATVVIVKPLLPLIAIAGTPTTEIVKAVAAKTKTARKKTPKVTKKVTPPKEVWWSSADIGKEHALSVYAVRQKLTALGYIDAKGMPSKKAVSKSFSKTTMITSKYKEPGTIVPYHQWSDKFVKRIFKPITELETLSHVTSRSNAQTKMCKIFVRAGSVFGINFKKCDDAFELDTYNEKEAAAEFDLSVDEFGAFMEAYGQGCYFMGGPDAFSPQCTFKNTVHLLNCIEGLVDSIYPKLKERSPSEALLFKEVTTKIMEWLMDQPVYR